MSEEFLTVSELNRFIKDVINAGFPQSLWICGEIQQYDRNKNKRHIFFDLVEKDQDSQDTKATVGVVIFEGTKARINSILDKSENAFTLKDDIEVKFLCKVDFYPPHGAVRLIIENIDPTYTLGKIAQERQRLIALLKKEGVLEKNKQIELPALSLRIGLITADDSAAYNDFISELTKSRFGFTVYLRNALMQGKRCEKDICDALDEFNELKDLDCIVITRGGGSIADLSCFDSKTIAYQVAASRYPVLSGIGHEINTTITDMAAHTYAKTPTAIAQFFVFRVQECLNGLDEQLTRIVEIAQYKIEEEKSRLRDLAIGLHGRTMEFLRSHNEKIIRMAEVIKYRPVGVMKDFRKILSTQEDILRKALKVRIQNDRLKLKNYEKMIEIVHPLNTMKRGFSITRDRSGKIIRSVREIKIKEELTTQLVDGAITSLIKEVNKEAERDR